MDGIELWGIATWRNLVGSRNLGHLSVTLEKLLAFSGPVSHCKKTSTMIACLALLKTVVAVLGSSPHRTISPGPAVLRSCYRAAGRAIWVTCAQPVSTPYFPSPRKGASLGHSCAEDCHVHRSHASPTVLSLWPGVDSHFAEENWEFSPFLPLCDLHCRADTAFSSLEIWPGFHC